jgi:hypothetical protein
MNKLYTISTLFIIFLGFQAIHAQFSYSSGDYVSPERSVIYHNDQELRVFPTTLENFGCPFGYDNPSNLIVHDPTGNTFVTFSGGMRMGRFAGTTCFNSGLESYATTKKLQSGIPTNLTDTITITFPTPVKFSNVFIYGKPNQQIRVTLDGTTSQVF